MKTTRLFFTFLLAFITLCISTGCSKKLGCRDKNALNFDPEARKSNENMCEYMGKVTFYTDRDVSEISVTIGSETRKITGSYGIILENCEEAKNATFMLREGKYYFSATSPEGDIWEGYVVIEQERPGTPERCRPVLLQRAPIVPPAYGDAAFWTADDLFGNITVSLDGQSTTMTRVFWSAPPCNTSGAANFTLEAKSYYVYALAEDGTEFGGTIDIEGNTCNTFEFVWDGSGKTDGPRKAFLKRISKDGKATMFPLQEGMKKLLSFSAKK